MANRRSVNSTSFPQCVYPQNPENEVFHVSVDSKRGFGKRGICGCEIAGRDSRRRLTVDPAARATSRRNLAAANATRPLASWAKETSSIASRRGASSNTITEHLRSQINRANRKDFGAHAADAGYAAGER